MARINLEDTLLNGPKLKFLCKSMPRFIAIGKLVELFEIAQLYWKQDRRLIPNDVFGLGEFPAEFETFGFIEKRPGGVYVCGSEDQFEWLHQRIEAGRRGGKKSGEIRENKALEKANNKQAPSNQNPLTLPLTLTPVLNLDYEQRTKGENEKSFAIAQAPLRSPITLEKKISEKKQNDANKASRFVAAYVEAWQLKFGAKTRPDVSGKVQGQIKTLLADHTIEEAIRLMETYLRMDEQWFKTKSWDFTTFLENKQKVMLASQTQKFTGPKLKPKGCEECQFTGVITVFGTTGKTDKFNDLVSCPHCELGKAQNLPTLQSAEKSGYTRRKQASWK